MKHSLLVLASSVLLGTGCYVSTYPDGQVTVGAALPEVVEVGPEGYYYYQGHHYYYNRDQWYYSDNPGGRRRQLPRTYWPRETRRRGY